jgi:hypothetical protein
MQGRKMKLLDFFIMALTAVVTIAIVLSLIALAGSIGALPMAISNQTSGRWDFNNVGSPIHANRGELAAAVSAGAAIPANRTAHAKLPAWRLYTLCPVNRRNVPTIPDERTA